MIDHIAMQITSQGRISGDKFSLIVKAWHCDPRPGIKLNKAHGFAGLVKVSDKLLVLACPAVY